MRTFYIYGLFDNRIDQHKILNEKRYIGKSFSLQKRLRAHLHEASVGHKCLRCNWIRKVLREGGVVDVSLLLTCDENTWEKFEISTIKEYREAGHRLTNLTNGGEGCRGFGHPNSPEAIAKIVAKTRGQKRTQEQRKRMSIAAIERIKRNRVSLKWREMMSKINKGKKLTPERIAEMIEARHNWVPSAEARLSFRNARLGKKHTLETIEKIRNYKRSEESNRKRSETMKKTLALKRLQNAKLRI